jgi:peroxiredoxin
VKRELKQFVGLLILNLSLVSAFSHISLAQSKSQNGVEKKAPPLKLKVGDTAPEFTLLAFDGKELNKVSLQDYRGKKTVVLAFFVFAFTGGWTQEMKALQQNLAKLESADTQVLGVSMDSPFSNFAFAQQNRISFPILGDWGGPVTTRYGLAQRFDIQGVPMETARRATFLIDKSGKIINEQVDDEAVDPTKTVEACERHKLNHWAVQRSRVLVGPLRLLLKNRLDTHNRLLGSKMPELPVQVFETMGSFLVDPVEVGSIRSFSYLPRLSVGSISRIRGRVNIVVSW